MRAAYLAVDLQPGFCEGGDEELPVQGGNAVCEETARFLESNGDLFDQVVFSRDEHIDPGEHFSDDPDFDKSWTPHCRKGTSNAQLHPAMQEVREGDRRVWLEVTKGAYSAAYSAFEGVTGSGQALHEALQDLRIDTLFVGGLAIDYCVLQTILDARRLGYRVYLVQDLSAAVFPDTRGRQALEQMRQAGVQIITSDQIQSALGEAAR